MPWSPALVTLAVVGWVPVGSAWVPVHASRTASCPCTGSGPRTAWACTGSESHLEAAPTTEMSSPGRSRLRHRRPRDSLAVPDSKTRRARPLLSSWTVAPRTAARRAACSRRATARPIRSCSRSARDRRGPAVMSWCAVTPATEISERLRLSAAGDLRHVADELLGQGGRARLGRAVLGHLGLTLERPRADAQSCPFGYSADCHADQPGPVPDWRISRAGSQPAACHRL